MSAPAPDTSPVDVTPNLRFVSNRDVLLVLLEPFGRRADVEIVFPVGAADGEVDRGRGEGDDTA